MAEGKNGTQMAQIVSIYKVTEIFSPPKGDLFVLTAAGSKLLLLRNSRIGGTAPLCGLPFHPTKSPLKFTQKSPLPLP